MEYWKIICKRDGLEPSVTTTYLVGKFLHFEHLRRKSGRQTRDHDDAFGRVRRLPQTFCKARDHLTSGLRLPGSMCPGFGINPRDSKGWTPIAIAAFHGHKKICQAWNRLLKRAESIFCLLAKAWRTSPTGVDDKEGRPKHRECIQADRQSFCAKMISLLASQEGCICHRQRRRNSRGAKRQGFLKGSPGML